MTGDGTVDLYWIPLGAGDRVVRFTGRVFEGMVAGLQRRTPCALYHSALIVSLPEGSYMIEQAPIPDASGWKRGVVAEGPVGMRVAGRFRLFRYEVRCWLNGLIPDLDRAPSGPVRLSDDADRARRVVESLPSVPTPTWGRDELGTGDMWNSNSVIAWVLASNGMDGQDLVPPGGGRAPGWKAGICVAGRIGTPQMHYPPTGQPIRPADGPSRTDRIRRSA